MKLLFDINQASAAELHEILGFPDSDFTFTQILPYLRNATQDVVKWIGKENYNIIFSAWENDTKQEVVKITRYTIALGAFREYAPLIDVSFTTHGRVFRSDDHMKGAFDWQIEKSDEAMERSYYQSLNYLIKTTLQENDLQPTPRIKEVDDMYVNSLDEFQNHVFIDDSYLLFLKLIPSLRLAEHQLILSRCSDKFETYKTTDNTRIKSLIQTSCVYFAMIDGLKKNSVQLFPRGVIQVVSYKNKKNQTAKRLDIEATVLYYQEQLSKLLIDLEVEIAKDKNVISTKRDINFDENDGFVTI